jgi:prepilin-type N-terminal cleavage/methylation domain-containing protein
MRLRAAGGFTLIELLIVVAVIGIIASMAIPGLQRARMAGNEASAIGGLRAINSGQTSYSTSCSPGGYAVSLADLYAPPAGSLQGFISPDLRFDPSEKSGYTIELFRDFAVGTQDVGSPSSTCNGSAGQPASSYEATADPITPGRTGTRYFATDTRGVIFFSVAGSFSGAEIPSAATVVQ